MLILFHYWSLPILFLLHDFEEMIFCAAMEKEGKIHFPETNENRQLLWESYRWLRIQHRGAGRVYRTPPSLSVLRTEP